MVYQRYEDRYEIARLRPIAGADRIAAIDTLRGFALLGILAMNIIAYAMPSASYFSPLPYGADTTGNLLTWLFSHVFFDTKMMAIFSMLFGAGLILMHRRAEVADRPFRRAYYRRVLWLLVIGLIHAYVFWYGDILVTYALCGLLLYIFRHRSARTLIILGCGVLVVGMLLRAGSGYSFNYMRTEAARIEQKIADGGEPNAGEQGILEGWAGIRSGFDPTPEQIVEEIANHRGNLTTVWKTNATATLMMHLQAIPFMMFWRALGVMLLGMGLMKLGVLTAERSDLSYALWIVVGLLIGLPLVGWGAWQQSAHNFDFVANFLTDGHFNYVGSLFVAMGFVGGVMLICKSGKLPGAQKRLAAVGRMALTNYLMHTLICVFLFYGYGFALFGQMSRLTLWLVVVAIWIVQLLASPWWLARFHFGPVEWLWRSLTYWRRQPMRIHSSG